MSHLYLLARVIKGMLGLGSLMTRCRHSRSCSVNVRIGFDLADLAERSVLLLDT